MPADFRAIANLSAVIDRYEAIISDVWGVLHNGLVATPGAREALARARQSGLAVVLLTNAPRPPASIKRQLQGLGIGEQSYDAIISSGGVTRALMADEGAAPFHHLGPPRDRPLYEGLAGQPVPLSDADYVLCTGLLDDETETAEDYRSLLETACGRGLKLYCANPDLVVERGEQLVPCAGAIAELYEALGGKVVWVGKPRPLVYRIAAEQIGEALGRRVDADRILCIGDALRTDIAGANRAGHQSIMTLAGIHAHQIGLGADGGFDRQKLEALAAKSGARPDMVMPSLIW